MKTTKIVEINVCDRCGKESLPSACSLCKREICERCQHMFHAHIDHSEPRPNGSSFSRISTTHNGVYCGECAVKIVKSLREYGLVEKLDARPVATMDVA